jgi:hypothetical protein
MGVRFLYFPNRREKMRQGIIRARSTISRRRRKEKEPDPENAGIGAFEALFRDLNRYGFPHSKWESLLGVVEQLRSSLGWNIHVPKWRRPKRKCGNGKACNRCRQAQEEINKIGLSPDIRLFCLDMIEKIKETLA